MYLIEGKILQNAKKYDVYAKSFKEVNRCMQSISNWVVLMVIIADYFGLLLIYGNIDNASLEILVIVVFQVFLYVLTFVIFDVLTKSKRKIVKQLKKYFYN